MLIPDTKVAETSVPKFGKNLTGKYVQIDVANDTTLNLTLMFINGMTRYIRACVMCKMKPPCQIAKVLSTIIRW